MKSKAPNERPFSACWNRSSGLTPRSLPRVGHLRDLVKDRVHGLPARRLHLAKVDVLDRVVRGLVEREIAARALERDVLECLREFVLVRGVATELLERLIECAHAVVLLHREDVRKQRILLLEVRDELLVLGVVELHGPEERSDRAVREVLHLLEHILFGQEAGSVHLVARRGEAELVPSLDEANRVGAREERVHVLGGLVLDLRHERREVRVAERRRDLAGDVPAVLLEARREVGLRLGPETVVRVRQEPVLGALRREVVAYWERDLIPRERGAENVRALAGGFAIRSVARERVPAWRRFDEDYLCLVHRVADPIPERRRNDAHHHVDLVLVDELLRFLDPGSGYVRFVLLV